MGGFVSHSLNGYKEVYISSIIELMGIDKLHEIGITGKNIKIGVIDSGVYTKHPWLIDKIKYYISLVGDLKDRLGHGTHVNGIISKIAPKSSLYNVKIIDKESGKLSDVIRALSRLYRNNVDIINMSIGSTTNCCNSSIELIMKYHRDTIHIASIGNMDGEEKTCLCPAMICETVSVGSIDPYTKTIAKFSSRGPRCRNDTAPTVVAPGGSYEHCIVSSFSPYALDNAGYLYACMSGTSQASPVITGLSALILEYGRELGVEPDIKQILIKIADREKPDNTYGFGLPVIKDVDKLKKIILENTKKPKTRENIDTVITPFIIIYGITMIW